MSSPIIYNNRLIILLLVTALLLGAAVRLYHFTSQSLDIDEFQVQACQNSDTLRDALGAWHFWGPDNLPLFYGFQYLWGQLRAPTPAWLRLLPFLMGMACIPAAFALARSVYGPWAGVIAAFLAAASPAHVWYATSLRFNSTFELAALLSLCALLPAVRKGGWRWAVFLVFNGIASWLHPMACWLAATEGAFILLSAILKRSKRMLVPLACCIVISVSPVAWLLMTSNEMLSQEDDFVMQNPDVRVLLTNFFGTDAALSADPYAFQGASWPFLPDWLKTTLVEQHFLVDYALITFFALCFALSAAWMLYKVRVSPGEVQADWTSRNLDGRVLLLMVSVLPLLGLAVLSFLWRPLVRGRYVSYSSFCLYAIAAGILLAVRPRVLRYPLLLFVAALYVYQLSVTIPGAMRVDWVSACRYINENAGARDPVLVKGSVMSCDAFRFHAGSSPRPILPTATLQSASERAVELLAHHDRVWLVIEPFVLTLPPLDCMESLLRANGVDLAYRYFPAMNGLHVYALQRGPAWQGAATPLPPACVKRRADFDGILGDLGYTKDAEAEYEMADSILARTIDTEWPRTPFWYTFLAFTFLYDNHYEMAEAAARHAIALSHGTYSFPYLVLPIALAEQGRLEEGAQAFERGVAIDKYGYVIRFKQAFDEVYIHRDHNAAVRRVNWLQKQTPMLPFPLRVRTGINVQTTE